MRVREPFFAYQGWYPSGEKACTRAISEYLSSFPGTPRGAVAGIVPHAGWTYSGKTAAWTFAALAQAAPEVVFLFGGHMHPGRRCICMPSGAFGTPLGPVPVEEATAEALVAKFGCERETPPGGQPDNTIELQMPFIRSVWPQASVVAVQVPPGPEAEAIGVWAAEWAAQSGKKAVALGSTDLTHYGPNYGFTPRGSGEEAHHWSKEKNDRPFIDCLLALDSKGATEHALANHSACCPGAAAAAVSFARARGATEGKLIEHTTSHEVESRGGAFMWVGYAAVVF
jgi:AmmeMemoRadiSam system protein B